MTQAIDTLFFAASDYPLLGMADVLPRFNFVTLYGEGPNCLNPSDIERDHRGDFTQLSNNLLLSKNLEESLRSKPGESLALFVMYDKKTVERAEEMGLVFGHMLPELQEVFDHKIRMTEFARSIDIPLVDQIVIWTQDPPGFKTVTETLGPQIVVQHPFGSSGATTFRVADSDRWNEVIAKYKSKNTALRVSRYLNCYCLCIDACVIGNDTLVGPIMSEINGNPYLTTLENSWCGNQVVIDEISRFELERIRSYMRKIGRLMASKGYRGYFSADFLYDKLSQKAFFSEVNPRISGGSTVANLSMHCAGLKPLIGHHIDQLLSTERKLDLDAINTAVAKISEKESWSQVIFKNLGKPGVVKKIPKRGVLNMTNGGALKFMEKPFSMPEQNPHKVYFVPEARPGDSIASDAEIGSLLSLTSLYDPESGQLTELADRALKVVKEMIEIEGER